MKLHKNLQEWLNLFTDSIPKKSAVAQFEVCQNLLEQEQEKVKKLEKAVRTLASDPHETVVQRIYSEIFPEEAKAQEEVARNIT